MKIDFKLELESIKFILYIFKSTYIYYQLFFGVKTLRESSLIFKPTYIYYQLFFAVKTLRESSLNFQLGFFIRVFRYLTE